MREGGRESEGGKGESEGGKGKRDLEVVCIFTCSHSNIKVTSSLGISTPQRFCLSSYFFLTH